MKCPILSVKDSLIGFGSTFTAVNQDVAIRGFTNSIVNALERGSDDSISPDDLSLYIVGEFDTVDGTISPCEPCAIARGSSIVIEYHANRCHCVADPGGDSLDDL